VLFILVLVLVLVLVLMLMMMRFQFKCVKGPAGRLHFEKLRQCKQGCRDGKCN
jgi:hypothetical protein